MLKANLRLSASEILKARKSVTDQERSVLEEALAICNAALGNVNDYIRINRQDFLSGKKFLRGAIQKVSYGIPIMSDSKSNSSGSHLLLVPYDSEKRNIGYWTEDSYEYLKARVETISRKFAWTEGELEHLKSLPVMKYPPGEKAYHCYWVRENLEIIDAV